MVVDHGTGRKCAGCQLFSLTSWSVVGGAGGGSEEQRHDGGRVEQRLHMFLHHHQAHTTGTEQPFVRVGSEKVHVGHAGGKGAQRLDAPVLMTGPAEFVFEGEIEL